MPQESGFRIRAIAGNDRICLFACLILAFAAFAVGSGRFGIGWDEPFYFNAGEIYARWILHPDLSQLDPVWSVNHEHPPLHKALAGLTEYLFTNRLGLISPISGYRLSTLPFGMIATASLFWLAFQLFGRFEAVLSCILLLGLPRLYFHSNILSLDYSGMAMATLVSALLWRAFCQGRISRWLGVAFAFAFLTKLSALMAPLGSVLLLLLKCKPRWKVQLPLVAQALALFFLTSCIGWPWLWQKTLTRFRDYFGFNLSHFSVPEFYFGTRTDLLPWHYPFVHLAIATPLAIFALMLAGFFFALRKPNNSANLFILGNALFPMLLVSLNAVKFDGIRHFLPAFPFLCLLAAAALGKARTLMERILPARIATFVMLSTTGAYLGTLNAVYFPYTDSFFSEGIGGAAGAEAAGFDVHLWCDAYQDVIPWLETQKGKTLWVPNCPLALQAYSAYAGTSELRLTNQPEAADFWVISNRRGILPALALDRTLRKPAIFRVNRGGAELVGVYPAHSQ